MSHLTYILPSNVLYIPQAPLFLTLIVLIHWPAISIPTIPKNIIQKFAAQLFRTDTSTAIDQYGILFISSRPAHYIPISIALS